MSEKISMDLRPKLRYWIPGAAVDEKDLREEIRMIAERGIGGIEAVVLHNLPRDILLSDDGWGSENWDRVTEILNDETRK